MEKTNLYKMAALLYSSEVASVKRDVAIRKIVENIIVLNENVPITIRQIVIQAKEQYEIILVDEEIDGVVTNTKNKNFQIDYSSNEVKICLKQKRYNSLCEVSNHNLDYYIDEYTKKHDESEKEKEIIHRYIYRLFENNLSEFAAILATNKIAESREEFTLEENKVIKGFIEWDNPEKNQMLSSIGNYALEYTFLTSNANGQNGNVKNIFKSKKIYLDTNIIFYCLGINGDDYAKTNRIFLSKCKSCKTQLFISYYTDIEFENTISHVTEEIGKYTSPSLLSNRFNSRVSNEDIYKLYLKWASGRKQLKEAKYFKAYLKEEYDKLVKDYNITVERGKPYCDKEVEENEIIQNYIAEISVKTQTNYDALNIYYIENKRGKNEDIINTQFIFISADSSLQRWDRSRNGVPVVVSPSAWLTIMARLVSRTDDDYFCFVNFINLKVVESEINNKEYFQVIQVLSEMIEDIETQENVLDVMVEENFSFLKCEEKRSTEFIAEKTQKEAKAIIDQKIIADYKKEKEQERKEIARLKVKDDENEKKIFRQEKIISKFKEDEKEKNQLAADNQKLTTDNEQLRLYKKKSKHLLWICIITLPVVIELFAIFVYKVDKPLSYMLYEAIIRDTIYQPVGIEGYFKWGQLIITIIIGTIDVRLSKIFWNKKAQMEYIETIKSGQ